MKSFHEGKLIHHVYLVVLFILLQAFLRNLCKSYIFSTQKSPRFNANVSNKGFGTAGDVKNCSFMTDCMPISLNNVD